LGLAVQDSDRGNLLTELGGGALQSPAGIAARVDSNSSGLNSSPVCRVTTTTGITPWCVQPREPSSTVPEVEAEDSWLAAEDGHEASCRSLGPLVSGFIFI
jgi:hypothetical protein